MATGPHFLPLSRTLSRKASRAVLTRLSALLVAASIGANGPLISTESFSASRNRILSPNWQNTTIESRLCRPLSVFPKTRKHKLTLAGANNSIISSLPCCGQSGCQLGLQFSLQILIIGQLRGITPFELRLGIAFGLPVSIAKMRYDQRIFGFQHCGFFQKFNS